MKPGDNLGKARTKDEGVVRTTKEMYLKLLGAASVPKAHDDMPYELFLPAEALGNLEDAIIATNETGLEHSQVIRWDGRHQNFVYGEVFVGTPEYANRMYVFDIYLSAFLKPMAFATFHTHPGSDTEASILSTDDIAAHSLLPRMPYMHLLGHETGVLALLRTEKSMKLPKSSIWNGYKTLSYLVDNEYEEATFLQQARMIKELGLELYMWQPSSNERPLVRGDLRNGITLTRAYNLI